MADDVTHWFDECEGNAALFVRGRLQLYRPLSLFRDKLVAGGVGRAREILNYLQKYNLQLGPGQCHYFLERITFGRWLMVASYREAMRLVLDVEPVEAVLVSLAAEDRFVLRLRYVDQFTDDDVARVLNLKLKALRWPFVDAREARERSNRAYANLCERLKKRFPIQADAGEGAANVFPYYPSAWPE